MQKKDLKALVEEIYENLLERISSQKETSKEQVVGYLKDAIDIVSAINEENPNSINEAKLAFHNSYKELVKESLTSYENTNDKFEELTQLHKTTLDNCMANQIDLSTLESKFGEIQSHMVDEIKKANSTILGLSQKVAALEHTTNIDPLTKVFNRRALSKYLNEICSSKKAFNGLHFLMLDLDNFKTINDTYGHVAGDKILIFISNILRKTFKESDKIFRYGGEEFFVLLNGVSDEECGIITNKLLKLISSNNLIYLGEKISITASIGVTKLLENDTQDTVLSRADKALYISKNNGKNQVSRVME